MGSLFCGVTTASTRGSLVRIMAVVPEHHAEIALSLSNVSLRYALRVRRQRKETRGDYALHAVNLHLYRGETLGIVGANGAGKSTLLRLIAGIMAPDQGVIERHGHSVRLLGMQIGFLRELSGRDNALLGGMILGLSKQQMLARMQEVETFAGLGAAFENPIRTYSQGMKARLAFSVAISAPSDILLLDELMGVGDEEFQVKSGEKLREMIRSERTVVLCSHSRKTIEDLSTRALWLDAGTVRECGTPAAVLDAYYDSVKRKGS